jgi:catechol-2,3-dioxygenase
MVLPLIMLDPKYASDVGLIQSTQAHFTHTDRERFMAESESDNLRYGCLLRVSDLNKVRTFYRDVLELGDPIVDSNFWLEFGLPGNGILAIEQCNTVCPDENRQDVSCLIEVDHFELRMKTLEARSVKPIRPSRELPGLETATVSDPEGNMITLYSRKKAE